MVKCKICNREFKNINGLAKHITKLHVEISKEEYYQTHINEQSKACECGKLKTFRNLGVGYLKHCSQECLKSNPSYRFKQRNCKLGKKQTQQTVAKRQATILKRHGTICGFLVNHPKIFNYKGLTTRSSYERKFLDFAEKYNFSISAPPKIKYEFENRKRWYYPDFYINELNLLVEIKSKWTWLLHEEMNITKIRFTRDAGFNIILIDESNGLLDDWDKLNEYILSGSRRKAVCDLS